MSLFGGQHIPWNKPPSPSSATLAAEQTRTGAAPPAGEQAVADSPRKGRWRNRSVSTRGLTTDITPRRIASACRMADEGSPAELLDLIQEASDRDPTIVSLLGVRKAAVSNAPWEVLPGDDRATSRRIAQDVERMLRAVPHLEAAMTDLLASIECGHAAVEIMWEVREGWAVPSELLYRPPRWFRPSPDDPRIWRLLSEENLVDGVELVADKWVTHQARAKPGFPVQSGLGRVLLRYWLLKYYSLNDWSAYSEMYGAPLRVGKYALGSSSPDQINELSDALEQLGSDSWAAIPADMSIEFVGDKNSKSGPDVYEKFIGYLDSALAKLVLGATLTSDSGTVGSQALGRVHNDVRLDIRQADARELAASLTSGLIAPYVRFNYGPTAVVPRLNFLVEPQKDRAAEAAAQAARAEVFKRALALGLPVSRAQVLEELGLSEPQGAGDELRPARAPSVSGEGDPEEPPEDGDPPPEDDPEADPEDEE